MMNSETRNKLIDQYKDGYRAVADALAGATDAELDSHPAPGKWSAREIVHHLADSEMTSAIRLRRLIAEDHPVIDGYDEVEFAKRLTSDRPIEPSLEAMRWARESTAQILERLTDDDWQRTGTHNESGPYSVERWLTIYANHGHDHAKQIERSRGRA
jgi:hypothetical protein